VTRHRLDTNLLVRFLTHDDAVQAAKADALFRDAADGRCALVLGDSVLIETEWVLRSAYGIDRAQIADRLARLIVQPGVHTDQRDAMIDGVDRYRRSNLDIVDCVLAACAAADGDAIATFDEGIGRTFNDVARWDHENQEGGTTQ